MSKKMRSNLIHYLLDIFYPQTCIICGRGLGCHEKHLCSNCLTQMPVTLLHEMQDNPMEQLFWGKVEIEKATALFQYGHDSLYSRLILAIKYRNERLAAQYLGALYAKKLKEFNWFNEIEYLIPIPLKKSRLRKRGYNQSEEIAKGIEQILNIPVESHVLITKTKTQEKKSIEDRWKNRQEAFQLNPDIILSDLQGKNVLLIDDIITSGATLTNAAITLKQIPGIKIFILTLAIARPS